MESSLVILKMKITKNISYILPFQLKKIQKKKVTQSWGGFRDIAVGLEDGTVFQKGQWTIEV